MKPLALALCIGLTAACASTPESAAPEGLTDMRQTIGEQRAAAQERENSTMMRANELSKQLDTPWYDTAMWPFEQVANFISWF